MSKHKIGPVGLLALVIIAVTFAIYATIQPAAQVSTEMASLKTISTPVIEQQTDDKATPPATVDIGTKETELEADDPDLTSEETDTPAKPNPQANDKTIIIKPSQSGGARVYDKFVPSESISEDLAVSFPVDI